jgi:hypothetical protein
MYNCMSTDVSNMYVFYICANDYVHKYKVRIKKM